MIKAAGDGEVIIDGRGNFNLFNVKAADYNYFEGITFRNTDIAIWAGTQFIAGSKGLTVKRCRFEQVGMGVFSNYSGSSNFYIADSVFLGRNDPKHLTGWNGAFWEQFDGVEGQEFPPVMKSYTAIRLYGPGHVVAYNYVADFHDGIDTEMYGMPDGSHAHDGPAYPPREFWDRRPVAIDIYNNYITNAHDNSIEMDGSMHNIRLMRNVLINSASHPMSHAAVGRRADLLDPQHRLSRAGRIDADDGRVAGRALLPQHRHHRDERRLVGERALAQQPDARPERRAGDLQRQHQHQLQLVGLQRLPAESRRRGVVPVERRATPPAPGARPPRPGFATLADYAKATRQDQNSVTLDYDVFVNVPKLDRDPKTVQRLYDFKDLDFRLRPGSAAIDRGVALPNVNDGFAGKAPDLGALEAGSAAADLRSAPARGQ